MGSLLSPEIAAAIIHGKVREAGERGLAWIGSVLLSASQAAGG